MRDNFDKVSYAQPGITIKSALSQEKNAVIELNNITSLLTGIFDLRLNTSDVN